ncbi:MAG: hypothetical protein IIB57_08540 [Planctomycetes bacterium]|nr:hypothetical protein [Planctomycetota bacterium]
MLMKSIIRTIGACMAVFGAAFFATGCSFDPMNYLSRNACEFVNCDELFFIEDMLPLSARASEGAATGGAMVMDMAEEEDEGGGHAH